MSLTESIDNYRFIETIFKPEFQPLLQLEDIRQLSTSLNLVKLPG